jgi:23S rRNA pseudouridine1911/1915/1917 synthase
MSERLLDFEVDTPGSRLDKVLAERVAGLSRSMAQRLIEQEQATVNGEPVKASYKVKPGDRVTVVLPSREAAPPVAEPIPLAIVYEDAALLAIDKPPGMVVHPAPGHACGTLVNAVLAHCPELAADGGERPGIVHRLDRDTSGLILVAKSEKARRALQRQFQNRTVRKRYLALLEGHLRPAWGRVEAPIGRDPAHRQRMTVLPGGREAVTEYHVLEQYAHQTGTVAGNYTLIEAEPQTGRTHQIRVHFSSIGYPLAGDAVYGKRRSDLPIARQFLHASRLQFRHPLTGLPMDLEAPLAPDLAAVLELLRGA